jgi:hypothetical protein
MRFNENVHESGGQNKLATLQWEYPEDGSRRFLRNVSSYLKNYTSQKTAILTLNPL